MQKKGKIFCILSIIGIISFFIGFFSMNVVFLLISFGTIIAAFALVWKDAKQLKMQKQENFKKQHPYYNAEQFYKKCINAGLELTGTSTQAEIARAKLIAEENKISLLSDRVVETFLIGKAETQRISTEERYKSIYENAKSLEKLLSYHGREKELFIAEKTLAYYKNLAYGGDLPLQKEQDWALMGGIASGIAGGAAGVAVAADIQMKNAVIRERNAQLRMASAKASLPMHTKAMEAIEYWENSLEKVKHYLVDDSCPDKLFEKLEFSNESVFVLSDGAFVVQASVVVPHVKIFNTEEAIIDGSITAVVYQNGEIVGEAPIVILRNGEKYVNRIECNLIGASSSNSANPNIPCKVEFKCRDLWAIEI